MGWFKKLTGIDTPNALKSFDDSVRSGASEVWQKGINEPFLGGAERDAARTQAAAAEEAKQGWSNYYPQVQNLYDPYQQIGTNALNQYVSGVNQQNLANLPASPSVPGAPGYNNDLNTFNHQTQPLSLDPGQGPQNLDYQGRMPTYGGSDQFSFSGADLANDPGVKFRMDQAADTINRKAGAAGKRISGNRVNDLLTYSQDLASQEFGNAFNRALTTSEVNQGRNLTDYNISRGEEADQYGRTVQQNQLTNANEAVQYGRGMDQYNVAAQNDLNAYNRGLTKYGIDQTNEQQQYERQQRAYAQDVQAVMQQYGIDYQQAVDIYKAQQGNLDRQAQLANLGINTTNTLNNALLAKTQGETGNILNIGEAKAAGQLGSANAIRQTVGQIAAGVGAYGAGGAGAEGLSTSDWAKLTPGEVEQAKLFGF